MIADSRILFYLVSWQADLFVNENSPIDELFKILLCVHLAIPGINHGAERILKLGFAHSFSQLLIWSEQLAHPDQD
jgi:hypothetical protein